MLQARLKLKNSKKAPELNVLTTNPQFWLSFFFVCVHKCTSFWLFSLLWRVLWGEDRKWWGERGGNEIEKILQAKLDSNTKSPKKHQSSQFWQTKNHFCFILLYIFWEAGRVLHVHRHVSPQKSTLGWHLLVRKCFATIVTTGFHAAFWARGQRGTWDVTFSCFS